MGDRTEFKKVSRKAGKEYNMKTYPYHAIQKVGAGKRCCYLIEKVVNDHLVMPADSRRFRTETAARTAASSLGIEIEAVGDLYEII